MPPDVVGGIPEVSPNGNGSEIGRTCILARLRRLKRGQREEAMTRDDLIPELERVLRSLQQRMPGFRRRESQMQMFTAVADVFTAGEDQPNIAVVEAPCGVGKSVGYAVPGILAGRLREMPVVIATGTVALQEQLCQKDLPALQAYGGLSFSFVIAKGRGRYLCPAKLASLTNYDGAQRDLLREAPATPATNAKPDNDAGLYALLAQQLGTQRWNGDRDSLTFPVEDATWRKLTNDRHGCVGNGCRFRAECPFFVAREHLRAADVIVTNHDLLLADLAMGGGTILPDPEKSLLVIDEGHGLPERAVTHFAGETVLSDDFNWLAKAVSKVQTTRLLLTGKRSDELRKTIAELAPKLNSVLSRMRTFGQEAIKGATPPAKGRSETTVHRYPHGVLPEELKILGGTAAALSQDLSAALEKLVKQLGEAAQASDSTAVAEQLGVELGEPAGRLASMSEALLLFGQADPEKAPPVARWFEAHPTARGGLHLKACASPITSASRLADCLWSRFAAVVSTSATLRTEGTFARYLRRSGLARNSRVRIVAVDSPFDFEKNGLLMLPHMQHDPGQADAFTEEITALLPQLIHKKQATLVLFCSKWQMNKVADGLPAGMRKALLIQGSEDRQTLLAKHAERVKSGQSSILFGMASFAEGLDLPGALCEHVIITKLPFKVPDSPVEAAIVEWLSRIGRNPFMEVAVPDAALKLTQACGRLLRSESDKGTVTILDRRVSTARYGGRLLASLPPFARALPEKEVGRVA